MRAHIAIACLLIATSTGTYGFAPAAVRAPVSYAAWQN